MEAFEFNYSVGQKLEEIFAEHCNLSNEQYAVIKCMMEALVKAFQGIEPHTVIREKQDQLKNISDFILRTNELNLKVAIALDEMVDAIEREALKAAAAKSYGQLIEMMTM